MVLAGPATERPSTHAAPRRRSPKSATPPSWCRKPPATACWWTRCWPSGCACPHQVPGSQRRRNLTVDSSKYDVLFASVTHVLITHCQKGYFDHLDRGQALAAMERQLLSACRATRLTCVSAASGVQPLNATGSIAGSSGARIAYPCLYGRGWQVLMAHGRLFDRGPAPRSPATATRC